MASSASALGALLAADLRNIRRDTLLRFLLAYPLVTGILLRYLIPFAEQGLRSTYDIRPHYPLLVPFFGMITMPAMAGLVIGLLLLDERDEGTMTALQVTPLPMRAYLGYRMLLPTLWSIAAIFIMVPLMGIGSVGARSLLAIGVVGALLAPIFALIFIAFAANKVQGLALSKGISVLLSGPFIAWFVPAPWQYLFGIFPSYWPMKAYWAETAGGNMWPWLAGGVVVAALYIVPLLMRFNRTLYRTG